MTKSAGVLPVVFAAISATGPTCPRRSPSPSASASGPSTSARRSWAPNSAWTWRARRRSCRTRRTSPGRAARARSPRNLRLMLPSGAMTASRSSLAGTCGQRPAASTLTNRLFSKLSARRSWTTRGRATTAACSLMGRPVQGRATPWLDTAPTEASCLSPVRRSSRELRQTRKRASPSRSLPPWSRSTTSRCRTSSYHQGRGPKKASRFVNLSSLAFTSLG
mmetsp:Transcript_104444/g.295176  ORF Transcript_104444/g.295176 Transcript_104444/m.295176 type:complete len:221 (-) Transcript_104444:1001-1663(-)